MRIIDSDGLVFLEPCHFDKHWWLPIDATASTNAADDQAPVNSTGQDGATPQTSTRLLAPLTLSRGNGKRRKSSHPRLHQSGHGINSTRRDPSAFEVVNQHASTEEPPRSQSFQELLNSDISPSYEDFLSPRFWGYAGQQPFDSD
jgi:hypothetical protein